MEGRSLEVNVVLSCVVCIVRAAISLRGIGLLVWLLLCLHLSSSKGLSQGLLNLVLFVLFLIRHHLHLHLTKVGDGRQDRGRALPAAHEDVVVHHGLRDIAQLILILSLASVNLLGSAISSVAVGYSAIELLLRRNSLRFEVMLESLRTIS